jgi:hypothetical protein
MDSTLNSVHEQPFDTISNSSKGSKKRDGKSRSKLSKENSSRREQIKSSFLDKKDTK